MSATPSLSVREFSLTDLRCHEQIRWQCADGVNLLSGSNGSGKTTLLEAVYMMAHGRSFRQARDPELVRWGQQDFNVTGVWKRYGPLHVKVRGKKGNSEILLQGKKISRRKELTETLPVVVDAPQAGKLVDGVPNERRRWLDGVIYAADPGTFRYYQNYLRALMQRSRLLRRTKSAAELDVWEHQLVQSGMQVQKTRARTVEVLNRFLAAETELMETVLHLEMKTTAPDSEEGWLARLSGKREEDARLGRLQVGPHCDQLKILFGGREIRSVGSRGQQKLAAMALRLAECGVRLESRHLAPLLLLDDCLEALDQERQQRLIRRLCSYQGQILMTVPNGVTVPKGLTVHPWHLSEGAVKEGGLAAGRPKTAVIADPKMEKAA